MHGSISYFSFYLLAKIVTKNFNLIKIEQNKRLAKSVKASKCLAKTYIYPL